MPTNTSTNPGTVANTPASPSKTRKAKTTRKAAAPKSSGAPAPSRNASAEILFNQEPNPAYTPQPPYIWIDFPLNHERLLGPVYVIRLGVGGAQLVELAIDGGSWQPCRQTSGYWWYDWSGIQPGKHTLVARMRTDDGRWFRTPLRNCDYRP
jgi:hypothetical protein